MVGAWKPECGFPLHAGPADEDVLQRIIEYVAHMQHTRHIRRGNHDRERIAVVLDFTFEASGFLPSLIPLGFYFFRIVTLL